MTQKKNEEPNKLERFNKIGSVIVSAISVISLAAVAWYNIYKSSDDRFNTMNQKLFEKKMEACMDISSKLAAFSIDLNAIMALKNKDLVSQYLKNDTVAIKHGIAQLKIRAVAAQEDFSTSFLKWTPILPDSLEMSLRILHQDMLQLHLGIITDTGTDEKKLMGTINDEYQIVITWMSKCLGTEKSTKATAKLFE